MSGLLRNIAAVRTMTSVMAVATMTVAAPALAQQVRNFDIPAQDANKGVPQFAKQAGIQILANGNTLRGKRTNAVQGAMPVDNALRTLLSGTGLVLRDGVDGSSIKTIVEAPRQNSFAPAPVVMAQAAQEARAPVYDEIIVTAQKKEERITDVPIAMSAFSAEALDDYKIEGGAELLRAVPNISFSKTNFSSYNFSIRGVGTKALSVASDPAVAISFNNAPMIRNRLFEQEYFDVERVEVLRGPQGTLYGRNATGGVVNMISSPAKLGLFEGWGKAELGNYESKRLSGMINVPIAEVLAVRAAGAWTKRDGYDFNVLTGNKVNGRDLWSARFSAGWEPSENFQVSAVWERFEEDDNRSRTGKQLCHNDPGPEKVGSKDISGWAITRGALSQGCLPGSLYSDEAYGVPNGLSLPYVIAGSTKVTLGWQTPDISLPVFTLMDPDVDPYGGLKQSRDLREISTVFDPVFRAKNDVFQLNVNFSPSDNLKFISQTMYTRDKYYSTQDYNRFNSGPVFRDSRGLYGFFGPIDGDGLSPGGFLSDSQLGRHNSIVGLDMVRANSSQWYQEFRIQSDNKSNINFNIGANYIKFKVNEDYFVFNNLFTALARGPVGTGNLGSPVEDCSVRIIKDNCAYVDNSPISDLDGDGHNYFRSINLAKTESFSTFGELYYNHNDDLKITLGLRYTKDEKVSTPVNSQLLLAPGFIGGGYVNRGFRVSDDIKQDWGRVTGRAVVDWKPDLSFTDSTLVYASFAKGYKGGGANPPGIDANPQFLQFFPQEQLFKPESLNAFEVGTKNRLLGGRMSLNLGAFYYDYKNYQVSQIVDRLALNENFDATIWGVEAEVYWQLSERSSINANLGHAKSRIREGESSIDVMNRTQGNPEWMVVKPWVQLASNCIAPKSVVEKIVSNGLYLNTPESYLLPLCGGSYVGNYQSGLQSLLMGVTYNPAVDAPNMGRGFSAPLGGNELPNTPRWTFSAGAAHAVPINDWKLTVRGDYYLQGSSWARVYNTEIDRLKSWSNVNLSVSLENKDKGLVFEAYVKNVANSSPITDVFINSDDSGLTANVFTLDPRIFGLSLKSIF